jgi:hypothetical protein
MKNIAWLNNVQDKLQMLGEMSVFGIAVVVVVVV